jgi:glutamate-1-semialdehyde 2,1-aminomutase
LNAPHDFVFGRYNDIDYSKTLVNEDIAAILVEPMQGAGGMIPGTREFLQFLRDAATKHGIILIFDEVITSRLHINGMQGYHSVYPDMTTLGKYIGGGFSFGAFGGRASIMDRIGSGTGSLFHSGTYNNNVFSMTAGVVAGKLLTESKILQANALGDGLRRGINNAVKMYKIQLIEATGFGSAVGIQFLGESRDGLRDAFFFFLLSKGIYVGKRGFISLGIMHEQDHIDLVLEAVSAFLEKLFGHAKF